MGIINIKNVSKKFGDKCVLDNADLEIQKGEMLAIVGESGKGKTTLLNIIGLILQKDSGTIEIEGIEVDKINSKRAMMLRRNRIGYLFQNFGLIDEDTVEWNLSLAFAYKKLSKKEKETAIEEVAEKLGVGSLLKRKVYELSGGEQQRVAIARLMLQDPNIVLADEPTGSLDKGNVQIVMNLLKEMHENGKTIIIVTHDLEVANQCTRCVKI